MFFVLSSGRSGSQTIAYALNSYSNCVCRHHPKPELVIEATQYYCGEYPADKIADVLRTTRPMDSQDKIYGEVNLQHSLLVPIIEQIFPEAKYIWLLRDGRDVVASMYYRRWYDPNDPKVPDEWKKARLQGDRTGDFSSDEWRAKDRFTKCCWLWKKYNLIIESHMQKFDHNRWMMVRLDRLKAAMPRIAQFLGLRDDSNVLVEKHNAAYQPVTYWEGWDGEMRKAFESMCGEMMDKWFPEWRKDDGTWQKIEIETPDEAGFVLRSKRLLLNLPIKIIYNASNIKRRVIKKHETVD